MIVMKMLLNNVKVKIMIKFEKYNKNYTMNIYNILYFVKNVYK